MKTQKYAFRIKTLIVLAVVGFVIYLYLPNFGVQDPNSPYRIRIRNAIVVQQALMKFEDQNRELPNRLSELLPKYLEYSKSKSLFPADQQSLALSDSELTPWFLEKIDKYGAYVYLGKHGRKNDIILYERPTAWAIEAGVTNVLIVSSNFTVRPRKWDEVMKMIKELP